MVRAVLRLHHPVALLNSANFVTAFAVKHGLYLLPVFALPRVDVDLVSPSSWSLKILLSMQSQVADEMKNQSASLLGPIGISCERNRRLLILKWRRASLGWDHCVLRLTLRCAEKEAI